MNRVALLWVLFPGIGFWGMSERFWRRLGRLRAVARSQSDPIKFPADTGYVP